MNGLLKPVEIKDFVKCSCFTGIFLNFSSILFAIMCEYNQRILLSKEISVLNPSTTNNGQSKQAIRVDVDFCEFQLPNYIFMVRRREG